MGIGIGAAVGGGDFDGPHHFNCVCLGDAARAAFAQLDDTADLVADGEEGIEGGTGFLEDHGDLTAANGLHFCFAAGHQVLPIQPDFALDDFAGRLYEADDGLCGHGFSGAAFTDQPGNFAAIEII